MSADSEVCNILISFVIWHRLEKLYLTLLGHLDPPDQQIAQTSAFIKVLTLTDDQLIEYIWLVTLLSPMKAVLASRILETESNTMYFRASFFTNT